MAKRGMRIADTIEVWRDIEDYFGRYQVSNFGRVKTLERRAKRRNDSFHIIPEKIKSTRINKSGYVSVYLSINKRYRHFFVHRLVAACFIGERPSNKHFVNHIDGNKKNNKESNLEWVTVSENHKHAFKLGLMCQKGENHATKKLNNKKVITIFNSKKSYILLATIYRVSETTIRSIKNGKSWSHITNSLK